MTLKYLNGVSLKHLILTIICCYFLLWLLDENKARGIVWNMLGIGYDTKDWVTSQNLVRRLFGIDQKAVQINQSVEDFLAKPNPKLLQIRNGFYNKPAGYYIQINNQAPYCQAKYSQEINGRWETPAKILCPQVKR